MVFVMNTATSTLPNDIEALKQQLIDLQRHHEKETNLLLQQICFLRAQLFGKKSEKIHPDTGVLPLMLFDIDEPVPPKQEDEEKYVVPEHTRKKPGRKPLPENLPRVTIVHDIPEEEKVCGCGCSMSRIGEETMEQLDVIPTKFEVARHVRPKYACPQCEGVEDDGPSVKIAPVVPQIIPKSIVTPGLLAYILTSKFVDHLPFYRLESIVHRYGVEISRTSMCNWAVKAAESCLPLLNLLEEEVLNGNFINADETPLQVLQEPGRSPTTKSYMWIFRRGDPDKPILIFQYHPTRAGEVARTFLHDYHGTVQSDGYVAYDFLDHIEEVRHIGCWAHARRKFVEANKGMGKKIGTGKAGEALKFINKLYKLEKEARQEGLTPDEIYQMRQKEALPLLNQLKEWLDSNSVIVIPKSLLAKAISYTLKQWHKLIGYTEEGYLTIDNNAAENAIRPFVIGRKNWLFSCTPEGASASACIYSLIETAKANKLEPYWYLRYIFEKLPTVSTLEGYEALLPWNINKSQLQTV